MRLASTAVAALVLIAPGLFGGAGSAVAAGPQPIEIEQTDGHPLKALLFRPEGDGPFPAVVALHSCAGTINRSGALGTRYRDWSERLVKDGYVVLLPDSLGSRGLGNQCGARSSVRPDRQRVADANAARLWLQSQSYVAADRVSLLGWSSGAVAVLWAARVRPQTADEKTPDFRSAVAFYPGCRRLGNTAWSARIPTLILIGRLDDQASAQACQQMVAGAKGRSAKVDIHVYPYAHHDFDHPNRPLQLRSGLAFSVDGSGRAHSGTNPAARADSIRRAQEWFAR